MLEQLNGDFIQRLRAFYYAAQTENIRKAAAMMQRHPSTLSYQISCLEKELHTTLFERSKTGLKLTPQGRKLRNWVSVHLKTSMSSWPTSARALTFCRGMSVSARCVP